MTSSYKINENTSLIINQAYAWDVLELKYMSAKEFFNKLIDEDYDALILNKFLENIDINSPYNNLFEKVIKSKDLEIYDEYDVTIFNRSKTIFIDYLTKLGDWNYLIETAVSNSSECYIYINDDVICERAICSTNISDFKNIIKNKIFTNGNWYEIYDFTGKLPLHYAASFGLVDMAKFILQSGANIDAVTHDINHATALDIAFYYGNIDMVKLLLLHKSKVAYKILASLDFNKNNYNENETKCIRLMKQYVADNPL